MVKSFSSLILFSGRGYLILWARCLKAGWHRSLQWPLKGKGTCHLTLESLCTRDFIQRSWALSFFIKRFISGFSCVHVCMGCWQRLGQGTRPDHLELESQVVVNCPAWVLGIAPGSSGRAETTCWVISPVPVAPFYSPVTSVQLGLSKICKYMPRMVTLEFVFRLMPCLYLILLQDTEWSQFDKGSLRFPHILCVGWEATLYWSEKTVWLKKTGREKEL